MTAATDRLLEACFTLDVAQAEQALANGADVKDRDHESNTPLLALLRQQYEHPHQRQVQGEIFALLIKSGALLQQKDAKGVSGFEWIERRDRGDLAEQWLALKGKKAAGILAKQMESHDLSTQWWSVVLGQLRERQLQTVLSGANPSHGRPRL